MAGSFDLELAKMVLTTISRSDYLGHFLIMGQLIELINGFYFGISLSLFVFFYIRYHILHFQ